MSQAEEMAALYAQVPDIPDCIGECHRTCTSNVFELVTMTDYEYNRAAMGGVVPHVADLVADCTFLTAKKRCAIYAMRPLICRLWGVVDVHGMRCPWGCKPERYLTQLESAALLHEAERIGGYTIRRAMLGH